LAQLPERRQVGAAIGYGFSSLTVPLALLILYKSFYTNRILNPAVVVIEVLINFYLLFINRSGVLAVSKRVFPILIGLLPGIAIEAIVVASVHPGWVKLGTYTVILPLILIQAADWQADSLGMDNRSPFWNGAGRPVFGNDHLRAPLSDFVQ
jgi:hypothetical protein